MRVIINADDLGKSDVVNQAIFSLMDGAKITSATLLAGGEAFESAASTAKKYPQYSFGVHLYLSELHSQSQASAFRAAGILSATGAFTDIRRVKPSSALKQAVYEEWCCQVRKVRDAGIPISHLDSHHHVHTIPWLFGTLKRVQSTFNIHRIRQSLNWHYPPEKIPSAGLLLKKWLWNFAIRRWSSTKTSDHFTSFRWFYLNMTTPHGRPRTRGVAELMVHPGADDYQQETGLLWRDWISEIGYDIQLITYNDL